MKNKNKNGEFSGRINDTHKVLVIGDPGVTKAELLAQFVTNELEPRFLPTVGVNIVNQSIELSEYNITVNLMFWDIAGQPQFYMLHRPYFNGADAMILVFDVTRSSTFSNVNHWYKSAVKYGLSEIPRILVGIIKDEDTRKERKIIFPLAEHLSQKLNAPYFEVSLDTGKNIKLVFQTIAGMIYRYENGENWMAIVKQFIKYEAPSLRRVSMLQKKEEEGTKSEAKGKWIKIEPESKFIC